VWAGGGDSGCGKGEAGAKEEGADGVHARRSSREWLIPLGGFGNPLDSQNPRLPSLDWKSGVARATRTFRAAPHFLLGWLPI
jgi:hypothetical protein